ncbi:MAG TPA: methyltransferase domain-containing protein [Hanamia sp.]|nr:methyltransferase domain-containing protein [Hanamia sp.]
MVQSNTSQSFSDKWHKNTTLAFQNTLNPDSETFKWITGRNGFKDENELRKYLSSKKRILDAGCGNGRVTALLRTYSDPNKTEIVGIDLTAADVAEKNLAGYKNVKFYKKNLLDNLTSLGKFDFIYCQEVLHHTGNARKGFDNLIELLEPGGEIAIYVYKQKAPAREFVDDYIREKIVGMDYETAMKHCRQITELGKALTDQNIKLKIPEVDLLQIKGGEYDLQRFIYHFFAKIFWNYEYNFEENAVINYDWYHPQDCTRHTIEEVKKWFNQNGLKINYEYTDFYGITVKGESSNEK